MKNNEEDDPVFDVIAKLPVPETPGNSSGESARCKVIKEFSDWVSSIKNVNLATKAKALWRHLNDKRTPAAHKAAIVAVLLYCIVPSDMVPDFIPFSGLLDDLAVVLSVLAYVDAKAATDKVAEVEVEAETGAAGNDCVLGKNINENTL